MGRSSDLYNKAVMTGEPIERKLQHDLGRTGRLGTFEAAIDSARAFLYAASVMLLVRRIARAA